MEIVDELCMRLFECRLVLHCIQSHVRMTLDELDRDLKQAADSARLAYGAASLLHQGAEMANSWTSNPARPKALFARHFAAVSNGAHPVGAQPSTVVQIEDLLAKAQSRASLTPASGRRCATYTKRTAKSCRRRVVRIGANELADHCPQHLNAAERQQFERYLADQAPTRTTAADALVRLGDSVTSRWLRGRPAVEERLNEASVPIEGKPDG